MSLPIRGEFAGSHAYGAPQLDVKVALNTNENPFEPPQALIADMLAETATVMSTINRYPDRDAVALREALANYVSASTGHEVGAECVWAANGSNEVLQQVLQLFGGAGRTALSFGPTYAMYGLLCRGTGTTYVEKSRRPDHSIDAAQVIEAAKDTGASVVFVCSPNNPTGNSVELDILEDIYAGLPLDCVLVVDEAYGEFSSRQSAVSLLPGRERLLVSRTMSKAFAYAGARVGYLVASAEVVAAMQLVRLPYHLSSLTQAAAQVALRHSAELQQDVEELKVQRDRIIAAARALGLQVADSDANFVLIAGLADPAAVWSALLARGVLVRDLGIPGALRITAGTPAQTDELIAALQDVLEGRTD